MLREVVVVMDLLLPMPTPPPLFACLPSVDNPEELGWEESAGCCGPLMLVRRGWRLGVEPQKDKEAQGGIASYPPHFFPREGCRHHPLLCHWW